MKIGLIFGVLALTAFVAFTAIQSLPVEATNTVAQVGPADTLDQEKHAKAVEENSGLRAALAELQEKNSTLVSTLDGTRAEKEKLETDLASLKAADAQRTVSDTEASDLSESLVALQEELSATKLASKKVKDEALAKSEKISQAQEKIIALEANIAALEEDIAEREANIADLKTNIADHVTNTASLERIRNASAMKISELESALNAQADSDPKNLELQSQLVAERDSALEELARIKKEAEDQTSIALEMTELVAAMKARISALQNDVTEKENAISELRVSNQTAAISPESVCQSRTDALTDAINFEGSTTSISSENSNLLNELTDIVAECIQEDVTLEIEGHTDSSGGIASNLLLSNGRANAVLTFLVENGIPADSMRAVGFGSNYPVADNATAEGRSLNQRIVFDWEPK